MAKEKETAKRKNTSKTARVLGLLTSPPPIEEEPAASPAPRPQAKPKVKPAPAAAPKPPAPPDDEAVEAQIRDALASELAKPLPSEEAPAPAAPAAPVPKREPVIQPPPVPAGPAPILTVESQPSLLDEGPALALTDDPQPSDLAEEPAPADKPAARPPLIRPQPEQEPQERPKPIVFQAHPDDIQDTEEGFTCFNVMQALVEAKTEKYIKLFGLCTCPRCRTDVVALALTNLPAKYLVATSKEMVPLLSVYESQYSAAVISQVMNACKKVMAHPRHNLSDA